MAGGSTKFLLAKAVLGRLLGMGELLKGGRRAKVKGIYIYGSKA